MKDYTTTLKNIAKKYRTEELIYDDASYDFIASVCNQFIAKGKLSDKQVGALVKISYKIRTEGPKSKPKARVEPDGNGFLGINCKTGDVNWYSWQIFESK